MLGSNRNREERSDDFEAKPRWREAPDTSGDSMITACDRWFKKTWYRFQNYLPEPTHAQLLIAQSETCMFFDSLISLKIVLVILCILNIKQSFVFTTVWAFLAVKTTFWVTHWFKKGCIDDELFLFLAT